jgi:hypothetical protein
LHLLDQWHRNALYPAECINHLFSFRGIDPDADVLPADNRGAIKHDPTGGLRLKGLARQQFWGEVYAVWFVA